MDGQGANFQPGFSLTKPPIFWDILLYANDVWPFRERLMIG
jgi:hypothetical protein